MLGGFGFSCRNLVKNLSIEAMDNPKIKEVRKVLCRHEEVTQANSRLLMLISSKLSEME
jgi:hypothetical protein